MMNNNWATCRNILCIRADNMGDVIMSSPAIRALKESMGCKITLLTSKRGASVSPLLPCIDETIVFQAPWVKQDENVHTTDFGTLVKMLKERRFDACVIFTVYSQNPMPAILLSFLAEIPLRLAYCRENPYHLLTDWVPEIEPYNRIRHQVQRDLDLVASVGATTSFASLSLSIPELANHTATRKRNDKGIRPNDSFLVFHCGVSEQKRQYPTDLWVEAARLVMETLGFPILFTGSYWEKPYIEGIQQQVGGQSISAAGLFSTMEFASVLREAAVVVTVNTSTVHLCAALQTPLVVLYARTNPQHTPWDAEHILLDFTIPNVLKSKNEVIRYVDRTYYQGDKPYPSPREIGDSVKKMLSISLRTALKSG